MTRGLEEKERFRPGVSKPHIFVSWARTTLLGAHEWDRYLRIMGVYQTIGIWIWDLGTLVVRAHRPRRLPHRGVKVSKRYHEEGHK